MGVFNNKKSPKNQRRKPGGFGGFQRVGGFFGVLEAILRSPPKWRNWMKVWELPVGKEPKKRWGYFEGDDFLWFY